MPTEGVSYPTHLHVTGSCWSADRFLDQPYCFSCMFSSQVYWWLVDVYSLSVHLHYIYPCILWTLSFFLFSLSTPYLKILFYYSFKIFLLFWLAKLTHITHHNQLLLTKFSRILPYSTNGVKSAAKLHIMAFLAKKT